MNGDLVTFVLAFYVTAAGIVVVCEGIVFVLWVYRLWLRHRVYKAYRS